MAAARPRDNRLASWYRLDELKRLCCFLEAKACRTPTHPHTAALTHHTHAHTHPHTYAHTRTLTHTHTHATHAHAHQTFIRTPADTYTHRVSHSLQPIGVAQQLDGVGGAPLNDNPPAHPPLPTLTQTHTSLRAHLDTRPLSGTACAGKWTAFMVDVQYRRNSDSSDDGKVGGASVGCV
jgi:hypothetical protein